MLMLLCVLFLFTPDSSYLNSDEVYLLKKGTSFELTHDDIKYTLSYDIWQNEYVLFNSDESSGFKTIDGAIHYIKETHTLPFLFIEKVKREKKKNDILFMKFIKDFIRSGKRKIDFENN